MFFFKKFSFLELYSLRSEREKMTTFKWRTFSESCHLRAKILPVDYLYKCDYCISRALEHVIPLRLSNYNKRLADRLA